MYKNRQEQQRVNKLEANISYESGLITLSGDWLWLTIDENKVNTILEKIVKDESVTIDATHIKELDTTGIFYIHKILEQIKIAKSKLKSCRLNDANLAMFKLVEAKFAKIPTDDVRKINFAGIVGIGKSLTTFIAETFSFLSFLGHFCIVFLNFLKSPWRLKWDEVSRTIKDAGTSGMWVVVLLCFLIGVTLTYEMSPQFVTYGANVYIVNFLGISLLKEVAPLLTAVIAAGRTGSAITAEIGTRKLQEELDALKTMGISPMEQIVLPKVLGVMIAIPLITAIGDIASMFGGALVAKPMLGISYSLFLDRMQLYVATTNYASGIIKSFAFAFLIALGGCFYGFKVAANANSIGEKTTSSVVLGIILVIFCDALFAIIFNAIGW